MIARRDPSPPRSGAAGSDRLRLLVASAAAAPARRLVAPGALLVESQRDGPAPAALPLLRGESVAESGTRRERQMKSPGHLGSTAPEAPSRPKRFRMGAGLR